MPHCFPNNLDKPKSDILQYECLCVNVFVPVLLPNCLTDPQKHLDACIDKLLLLPDDKGHTCLVILLLQILMCDNFFLNLLFCEAAKILLENIRLIWF